MNEEESKESSFEVVTIDKCIAMYADDAFVAPYQLWLINTTKGQRIYFRESDDGYKYYLGTTGMNHLLPISPSLLKAWCDRGYFAMKEHMRIRAVHGTYFHKTIALYAQSGSIEKMEVIFQEYRQFLDMHRVPVEHHYGLLDEMQRDILSYMKWSFDYKAEPLAIELPLCSDTLGIATMVDYIGMIDDRVVSESTGKEKQIRRRKGETEARPRLGEHATIMDMKTGKSGSFEAHIMQLEANIQMFQENFPSIKLPERFYNFAPKKWIGETPTYTFTDQSARVNQNRFDRIILDGRDSLQNILNRRIMVVNGGITYGENPQKLIKKMTVHEVVESGLWKEFVEENLL